MSAPDAEIRLHEYLERWASEVVGAQAGDLSARADEYGVNVYHDGEWVASVRVTKIGVRVIVRQGVTVVQPEEEDEEQ